MFFTTHTIVGSFIGSKVSNPMIALSVGVISHLALDSVPHWGNQPEIFWPVAVTDGILGGTAMVILARNFLITKSKKDLNIFLTALGAGLPDWDKPFREFFNIEPWPEQFNHVHRTIQKESPDRLFPELLLLATLIALFIITQYLKSSSLKNNRNNEIHNQHNNLKIFKKSTSKFTPSSRAYIQKQSTIDPDATNILSRFDKGRENNE